MGAKILVVDDVPANIRLLEAKLLAEYYDVVSASDGFEALTAAKEIKPDLILLDVMMPGMDGFECCQKLKQDPATSHIPVVMVTALSSVEDRVKGLESGADDFLTKPINDVALMARVKSLLRTKMLLDELRLRDQTGTQMGVIEDPSHVLSEDVSGASILLVDDDLAQIKRIREHLSTDYEVHSVNEPEHAHDVALSNSFDVIIISTMLDEMDGLRLATQFKSQESLRHVPILILVDEFEQHIVLKGLELGINDYLVVPADPSELRARVRTQVRRRRYQRALRSNYRESLSMAVTDKLTGLYNRHYLDAHLETRVQEAMNQQRPLSLMIMDMDHFKEVNDTYGHDCGDQVIEQLAKRIFDGVRSSDLPARFGGEEFVIVMPRTPLERAVEVAERIRRSVEGQAFTINHAVGQIQKTSSFGVTTLDLQGDSGAQLMKRADEALYMAKQRGRNCIVQAA
jgi:two-component system cell cycle response regulator